MQWTRYGTVTAAVYLVAGRPALARQALTEGAQAAAERQARGYRAPLLRLEAEALLCGGEVRLARQRAEEASPSPPSSRPSLRSRARTPPWRAS